VRKDVTAGFPAWKRGLLVGVIGLAAVGAAAGIRDRQIEGGREMVMGDASGEEEGAESRSGVEPGEETKKIALTFDDGPHPRYTEELLDGLAEREVKATFFLLGQNIEGREEIIERMAREGHLIGNHTYYHVDITRLSQREACREILDTSEKITAITGQPVEYIRPPFGNWDKELECEVMMLPIFWSVDTLDWTTKNEDQIVQKVVTKIEENDIILMHDSYDSTVKAALRIVDLLQAEGYEFVTADELILE
jgi:peptidoglycan/xylan/chitin deacetylase (PgdA/CDA1 family)